MDEIEVIIPNLNRRFSGITSTVIAVVPEQMKELKICSVGHPLDNSIKRISWFDFFKLTAKPLPNGKNRIFHCRRNIEMLYGLVFKKIFRRKIHLIFTSTAQRIHSKYTDFLCSKMDTLLSTSPRAASFMTYPPSDIIAHGVNIERYKPASDKPALKSSLNLDSNRRYIGIFGRVRPQKGVQEFVEALCEVLPNFPDCDAVITGQTTPKFVSFERDMKDFIKSRGLENRFKWMGKLDFAKIPDTFACMDVVVCASRNEGFGLTCLEAMASGVAVIATQTGGFELVIRDGVDGYIVPCNNAQAIAQKLNLMLSDKENLERMSKSSRERVATEFTIAKEASGINAVYKRLLAKD